MIHSLSGLTKVCFSIDNLERILSGWNAAHWESLEPTRGPTPHIHPQPPERSKGEHSPQRGSEMGVALGDDWCCWDRCSKAPAEGKALLGWAGMGWFCGMFLPETRPVPTSIQQGGPPPGLAVWCWQGVPRLHHTEQLQACSPPTPLALPPEGTVDTALLDLWRGSDLPGQPALGGDPASTPSAE